MYKKLICMSAISLLTCASIAMENQDNNPQRCLRDICKIDAQDLKLRNVLPGELLPQQQAVHDFIRQFPKVTGMQDGQYSVDVRQLRALLKNTVKALPRADGNGETTESNVRARQALSKSIETSENGSVTTVTIGNGRVEVQSNSPVLKRAVEEHPSVPLVQVTQINNLDPSSEVSRLARILGSKGTIAKVGALGSSLFVAGMIVGWFYTTRAHHQQTNL